MKTKQEAKINLDTLEEILKIVDSCNHLDTALSKTKNEEQRKMIYILWERKCPTFNVLHPISDYKITLNMPISDLKTNFLSIISNQTPFIITGYVADDNDIKQIFVRKMAHSAHAKPIVDGFLSSKDVAKRIRVKSKVIEFWCDTYNVPYAIGSDGERRFSAYSFDIIKSIKDRLNNGSSPLDI